MAKAKEKEKEKPSFRARFKFSDTDQAFEIDAFDLTAEEQVMVEEFFDQPWDKLLWDGWITSSRKGQVFLAYLARRRKEESFTYANALSFEPTTSEPEEDGEDGERPTKGSKKNGSQP